MKNEIGRKITSLTLMTIMVAGGLTFAFPSEMPKEAYAATANLFVSAENSLFDNSFAGPMVIEVVINDPDLKEIDEGESEPDVTVNGQDLRMSQATDGNWYAYFAAEDMARAADSFVAVPGTSLDFGVGCTADSASTLGLISYSDTDGVFFGTGVDDADSRGGFGACTAFNATQADFMNVVRENKTVSNPTGAPGDTGQIGLAQNEFPQIQAFSFAVDGTVEVKYNKGGDPQQIDLVYLDDADEYADLSLDRATYPQGASVHFVMTDLQLNIDPTDEDSWTFTTNATAQATARQQGTNGTQTFYQIFDENGANTRQAGGLSTSGTADARPDIDMSALNFDDNGVLILDIDSNDVGTPILTLRDNNDQNVTSRGTYNTTFLDENTGEIGPLSGPVTVVETQSNSGIFKNTDEGDVSNIAITADALRGTTATIDYNDEAVSILVANAFGTLTIDEDAVGGVWNSGEEVPVTLVDQDQNLNSLVDEDLDLNNAAVPLIPSVRIGSPLTLAGTTAVTIDGSVPMKGNVTTTSNNRGDSVTIDRFSDRLNFGVGTSIPFDSGVEITFSMDETHNDLGEFLDRGTTRSIFQFLNYDFRSLETNGTDIFGDAQNINFTISNSTGIAIVNFADPTDDFQGLIDLTGNALLNNATVGGTDTIDLRVNFTGLPSGVNSLSLGNYTMVADFFSFGQTNDGFLVGDRINNAIYRLELEESGDNTGTYVGSMEYIMLNQINVNQTDTYLDGLDPITDEIILIVHNDLTDEDSVRINYFDLGADGVQTQIADQVEAPTHSGVVSFDLNSYKVADTVVVTLEDQDLNTDVETIDVFTVVRDITDVAFDQVGIAGYEQNTQDENFGRLLDITFDDERWAAQAALIGDPGVSCGANPFTPTDDGLGATGFTLVETDPDSGIFTGDFQIPDQYCRRAGASGTGGAPASVTGTDMEVNYVDYRDASGEIIEVGDSAGVRANTGSVSLDRTVYPVPWGELVDIGGSTGASDSGGFSVFPVHLTGLTDNVDTAAETLGNGDLTIHVRINDPDFDVSASGEDQIAQRALVDNFQRGPLKVSVSRGADVVVLATAGGPIANGTLIHVGNNTPDTDTRELGPIVEVAPDAGIFELDLVVRYTDGPASATCPDTTSYLSAVVGNNTRGAAQTVRFDATNANDYCILQGDIITVEYRDPTDASGDPNTVTDSATFDLRNGVLQSDKSVYIIGGDMIMTLIEPDFDLENDEAETRELDLIEWDSDAATVTMGNLGGEFAAFDPEPSDLRETGDSTGIFQIVIEIPEILEGDRLERGEEVILEYTDWGPSGADHVGDEDEDINLTIFTSNFGATVELDQKVYTWTDKVYITIVAPDHNFDSDLIDEIGEGAQDPIKVSTRGFDIDNYRLVETGTDTGIFTGEIILTGFAHDADGDGINDAPTQATSQDRAGPTDGFLEADDDDGITVSFEFSEDETVVGSALIRWNIGEVQWLEASYPASGTGVVRVVDPDVNLDPEAVDNFDVDVWSDSDAGGIDLTVTETNEATGIFEGTVFFTVDDESSGHRLRVAEGDTITAEYEDNTLPDPYTTADELDITGTSLIGTVVPPLERAPAANARVVDSFGNALASVSVDQQVQITADLANGQDRDQSFAYLVQVQDSNGVTVELAWITGSLSAGQSFSPALSWIPDAPGTYTATVFVWESVDNPTALSPPVTTPITVN